MHISRLLLCMIVFVLMASCARPRYANENPPTAASAENNETSEKTSLGEQKVRCLNRFSNSDLCLIWSWEKLPTPQLQGSFIFKIYRLNQWDQTAVEVDLALVPEVILWMPSMGHGSTPTKVERIEVGTYRALNIFFIMPGDWEIRFQIKDQNRIITDGVNVAFSI